MYIVRLLECTSRIFKFFYLRCFVLLYSELCLAGISQKSQPPPPIPPKKSIGARPYGFKNLYPSKKPATVTAAKQLQKSIDFRWIELYDFHLWSSDDPLNPRPKTSRLEVRQHFFSNRVVEGCNQIPSEMKTENCEKCELFQKGIQKTQSWTGDSHLDGGPLGVSSSRSRSNDTVNTREKVGVP